MIGLARRRLMGGVDLPYDARIEYLERTTAGYVDLPVDVKAGDYFGIIIEIIPVFQNTTKNYIFGANKPEQFSAYFNADYRSSGYIQYASKIGENSSSGGLNVVPGEKTIIEFSTAKKYINNPVTTTYNTNTSWSRSIKDDFTSLRLFGASGKSGYSLKLCSLKVMHGSRSNIIYDMIPVRVGQVGYLYDKLSSELFGNSSSTALLLGPDV